MDMHAPAATDSALDRAAPISRQIWDAKYRLKAMDGTPIDRIFEDSWHRVARALAEAEAWPAQWEPPFYEALADFVRSAASPVSCAKPAACHACITAGQSAAEGRATSGRGFCG